MDLAGGWYASGTFWAGAGVVAGVLGTVAIVWVTFVVGFPRRRLFYRMGTVAPLMSAPKGMRRQLELRVDGVVMADPRVITVELVSRGRKDIANDSYNDGQPLELDVGCPIADLLEVESEPATLPKPHVRFDGTTVAVGPSLIGRRHKVTITLLTDGGEPALVCRSPLIDVQVRRRSADDGSPARQMMITAATTLAIGTGLNFLLSTIHLLATVGRCPDSDLTS